MKVKPAVHRALRGAVLPIAVIALWWAACALGRIDTRIVASPGEVVAYLVRAIASGALWIDLSASLARNLLGFGMGAVAGVLSGVMLSMSRVARNTFLPSINTLKQISIFAWVPLISIWFGLGESARLSVIAFAVWFPVLFNTIEGVAGIPPKLLDLPRVFGFSRLGTVRHVILPTALPSIFTGLYVGLITSWLVTLGAEYLLTSTRGLGHMLLEGREHFRMDQVMAGIIVIGGIGFLLHASAEALERRLLSWREPSSAGSV